MGKEFQQVRSNNKPQGAKKGNKFKKEHNNFNPYNKLELNKFHQVEKQHHDKQGHLLHKKKRDL